MGACRRISSVLVSEELASMGSGIRTECSGVDRQRRGRRARVGWNVPSCLSRLCQDHEGRPSGRRRTKLFLSGALVLLLIGILLAGIYEKKAPPKGTAAVTVKQDSRPAVVQVRAATLKPPRGENVPYVLSLGQEVYVDVRAAGMWLRQRMGELGKPNLDPRAKVTLETVVFDPDTEKANSVGTEN